MDETIKALFAQQRRLGGLHLSMQVSQGHGPLTLTGLHGLWYRLWSPFETEAEHKAPVKSFSLIPWHQEGHSFLTATRVEIGERFRFDVLSWDEIMIDQFAVIADSWPKQNVVVGSTKFVGEEAVLDAPRTVAELLDALLPSSRLRIGIHSPLSFRRVGLQYPLPEPELMLNSLAKRWLVRQEDQHAEIFRRLHIRRYELRTEPADFRQYKIIGAMGFMELGLQELTEAERSLVTALFKLGEYSGVGYGTTHGLGHIVVR